MKTVPYRFVEWCSVVFSFFRYFSCGSCHVFFRVVFCCVCLFCFISFRFASFCCVVEWAKVDIPLLYRI